MEFDEELIDYVFSRQRAVEYFTNRVKDFNHRGEYYRIKKSMDNFLEDKYIDDRFLIMPGLRGVGKTTILYQVYNYLVGEKNVDSRNILYISMDQVKNYFDIGILEIVDTFLEFRHQSRRYDLNKKIFLFIDECHFDKNWALGGKILYDNSEKIFLIFTGSSALNLELNPDVSRRSFKEKLFPNNFRDHLLLKYDIDVDCKFSKALGNIIYCGDEKYIEKGIELEIA
ncbi:MAG: AAA family ATPase, partial [Methanobrevibacter sp.]|nr:AAA family ATPase [Methanobrevibacter sp.]